MSTPRRYRPPQEPSPAHRIAMTLGAHMAMVAVLFGAPIAPQTLVALRDARAAMGTGADTRPRRLPVDRPRASSVRAGIGTG